MLQCGNYPHIHEASMFKRDTGRRTTPAQIGMEIGRTVPTVRVVQHSPTKLWLTEGDEPFCEVHLTHQGAGLTLAYSVHCSPAWAGIVTAHLARLSDHLQVSPNAFIQDGKGKLLWGTDADHYWREVRAVYPLVSARFTSPDPH